MRLLRVCLTILSTLIAISPILYAFSSYNWDVETLITPVYTPPKVNFDVKLRDVSIQGLELHMLFDVKNTGEINVRIDRIQATIYDEAGDEVGSGELATPISIASGETGVLDVVLRIDEKALPKLLRRDPLQPTIRLKVEGVTEAIVLGVKASIPISIPVEFPRPVTFSLGRIGVESFDIVNRKLVLTIPMELTNHLGTDISGLKSTFNVFCSTHSTLLGEGQLTVDMPIHHGSSATFNATLTISDEEFTHVVDSHLSEGTLVLTMDLTNGEIEFSAFNMQFSIPFEFKEVEVRGRLP